MTLQGSLVLILHTAQILASPSINNLVFIMALKLWDLAPSCSASRSSILRVQHQNQSTL